MTGFVALALLVALIAYIPIQQRILRWRAERLLADIHELQMGKSTWADARRIMTHWGAWGHYEGECAQTRCSYQIEIGDILGEVEKFNYQTWVHLVPVYEFFGGRSAVVVARFEVIQDVVWGKDFVLGLDVEDKAQPEHSRYFLFGSADVDWRTERFRRYPVTTHPEFVIGRPTACEGCDTIYVRYTPFADPSAVNRLLSFNFECLTHRQPCLRPPDLMPVAWTQYDVELTARQKALEANPDPKYECNSTPEFLGRDQFDIAIAQVVSTKVHQSDQASLDVAFHLISRVKRATFWTDNATWLVNVPFDKDEHQDQIAMSYRRGAEFILASRGHYPVDSSNWLNLDPCSPIPLTDENLAAVKRGVIMDIFPEHRDVWP